MIVLKECIESLQAKLERYKRLGLKETPTRTIFIEPLLQALGWDVTNWDEVELEYPTAGGNFVDYALKLDDRPVLFVEAKPLGAAIDDTDAVSRIIGDAAASGIKWCIITNGLSFGVYRTPEEGSPSGRKLFEVSIDPSRNGGISNQEVSERLSRFSKAAMAQNVLDNLAGEISGKANTRKARRR